MTQTGLCLWNAATDKRICWFDTDLSTKPYKILRSHTRCDDASSHRCNHSIRSTEYEQYPTLLYSIDRSRQLTGSIRTSLNRRYAGTGSVGYCSYSVDRILRLSRHPI